VNIALGTNTYRDFIRGHDDQVRGVRTAYSIALPLIVPGQLRAGFAAGARESANAANLQWTLASPRAGSGG